MALPRPIAVMGEIGLHLFLSYKYVEMYALYNLLNFFVHVYINEYHIVPKDIHRENKYISSFILSSPLMDIFIISLSITKCFMDETKEQAVRLLLVLMIFV